MLSDSSPLLRDVEARVLPPRMWSDLKSDLAEALEDGFHFKDGDSPEGLFRSALRASYRDISSHARAQAFQRFILVGPAPFELDLDLNTDGPWMSDAETAAAISYIYNGILEQFKGALAELLSVGPVFRLVASLKSKGLIPQSAETYWGDVVMVRRGERFLKGADIHILQVTPEGGVSAPKVHLCGVGEIKAGRKGRQQIRNQLGSHSTRAMTGLRVGSIAPPMIPTCTNDLHRISIRPSNWLVGLGYTFLGEENQEPNGFLAEEIDSPLDREAVITEGSYHEITLRWSMEALYAVAFEMTLWYFECIGETLYSSGVPPEWSEMSPSQAGRNAAKMRLNDAFQRARTPKEWNRAMALFNSYSFGWALGKGFRTLERDLIPDLSFRDLRRLLHSSPEALGWYRDEHTLP